MSSVGGAASVSLDEKDLRKFAIAIQAALNGRSNAGGSVTLTASAGSTTVSAPNCSQQSKVLLFPTTANAAAALATTYISAVARGSFTITHANNAQADKTFFYVCLG
jgi:hypothetical protein